MIAAVIMEAINDIPSTVKEATMEIETITTEAEVAITTTSGTIMEPEAGQLWGSTGWNQLQKQV